MKVQDTKARATGVVIFGEYEPGAPARIEVRAFAPTCGINEAPVRWYVRDVYRRAAIVLMGACLADCSSPESMSRS